MADVPPVSRIARSGRSAPRPYRVLMRGRLADRVPRERRQLRVGDLLRSIIARHGLSDEVRQRAVCLYWDEIAGARLAPKTWPVSFHDGTLHVETETSTWVHELHFHKAPLIARINAWVDANRSWVGPPPLVTDIRFGLGMRRRIPTLVDREHARQIAARQRRRLRPSMPRDNVTADVTQRDAILAETAAIDDPELRAIVENVRVTWNV